MTAAAVILAAGAGQRFDGATHKLVVSFRARPLMQWSIDAAVGAALDETVVILGAHADVLCRHVPDSCTVIVNEDWASGQASSLALAVDHAGSMAHDAVVVGLADQPFVTVEAWRRVAASRRRPIGVATYAGARRHPVRLSSPVWSLVPRQGDEGMRSVMRLRPELVGEVPCPGQAVDIDTVEDLERWS